MRGEALEQLAVAVARHDRDDTRLRRRGFRHEGEQALLALVRLLVHVRDLDPVDRAGVRPDRERGAGIVGVHVHLDGTRVTDDEQRVAELLQLSLERFAVEFLPFDQEHGAVAELRQLLMDRVVAQVLLDPRRLGDRFAGHGRGDAAHELEEACAARVDDTGVFQDLQLLRRAREGVLTAAHQVEEQLAERRLPGRARFGLLRQLADHRQHRPLDGAAHRAVRRVARAAQRARGRLGVDRGLVGLAEHVGGTADDLREDHAGVAASSHQRAARDVARERMPAGGRRLVDRVGDGAHGHRQVRAGVAVGNGIDVQVVDARAVRLERRERASTSLSTASRSPFSRSSAPPHVVDVHLDRPHGKPREPLDLVADLLRIVDATSARFKPYSTTTWRSIVTPSPLPPISIPRVARSGSHFRPAIPTTP